MEPGVAIALGFLWFLFNVLGKRKKSGGPVRRPHPTGTDATQREGARLQDMLRGRGRTPLESSAEGRSLEDEVRRPSRAVVDLDDEAEQVAARRVAAAEGNRRALRDSDHIAFDERIRREAADATATRATNIAQLRTAVIWSEILGPPISLRAPDDR